MMCPMLGARADPKDKVISLTRGYNPLTKASHAVPILRNPVVVEEKQVDYHSYVNER